MNLPIPTVDLMTRYEEKMLQKRALEKELKEMANEILPALPADTKIETFQGVFAIESKPKWEYTPMIKADESRLKAAKKLEEQNGDAVQIPGAPYLIYRVRGGSDEE